MDLQYCYHPNCNKDNYSYDLTKCAICSTHICEQHSKIQNPNMIMEKYCEKCFEFIEKLNEGKRTNNECCFNLCKIESHYKCFFCNRTVCQLHMRFQDKHAHCQRCSYEINTLRSKLKSEDAFFKEG